MYGTTSIVKRLLVVLTFGAVVAALVVPAASAGHPSNRPVDRAYFHALTSSKQQNQVVDGRSPDTRDAAAAAARAGYGPVDPQFVRALMLLKQTQASPLVDGRAPDTIDAAIQAHAPVVTVVRTPGFQWDDFGIGIAAAFGLMLLLLASARVLATRNRRPGPVATA
jgi:hypothetical protein